MSEHHPTDAEEVERPVSDELMPVMAAVGVTLATAQVLEMTLVGLILILDQRVDIGVPVDAVEAQADTLRGDPLGTLITKLGQVSGATADELRDFRELKRRRDEFVHNFCIRPGFMTRAQSEQGRRQLLDELRDLGTALDSARRSLARLSLGVGEERFGVTAASVLAGLRQVAETGHEPSRLLPDGFAELFQQPGMLELAERMLAEL